MTDINRSISATIKSISGKKNLIFSFNNNFSKIEKNKVFLPNSNLLKKNDIKNYRGIADFLALKLKYHKEKIYKKFKPNNQKNLELFDALEETRIITLGSIYLKGIACNLRSRIEFFCKKNQFNKIKKRNNSQITQVIKLISTESFINEKLPKNTLSFINLWKPIIMPLIIEDLIELKKEIKDQEKFSKKSLELIKKIEKFSNKNEKNEQKKVLKKKEVEDKKKIEKEIKETNNSFFQENEFNSKKNLNRKVVKKRKDSKNKKQNLNDVIAKINEDI